MKASSTKASYKIRWIEDSPKEGLVYRNTAVKHDKLELSLSVLKQIDSCVKICSVTEI